METIELLHVTKTQNIESILNLGLLRSKPRLSHHYDQLKPYLSSKWDGKVSYFNEPKTRWLKDFIYWESWGQPINDLIDTLNPPVYARFDAKKLPIYQNHFTLLKVKIPIVTLGPTYFKHLQTHNDSNWYNAYESMDPKHEHDDKPMIITTSGSIEPKNISIIGTAESKVKRNNSIDISLKW